MPDFSDVGMCGRCGDGPALPGISKCLDCVNEVLDNAASEDEH